MNIIKTSDGKYVEVQGTGEESTFSAEELTALLAGADTGLDALFAFQKKPSTALSNANGGPLLKMSNNLIGRLDMARALANLHGLVA